MRAYRGHSFLSLNADLLERYANCASASEIIETQNRFLESLREDAEREHAAKHAVADREAGGGYLRASDLPPSDSDEYSDEGAEEDAPNNGLEEDVADQFASVSL